MTPETRVKGKLKKYLTEVYLSSDNGYYTSISDRYKSGMPDFMAIQNGHVIFFEAKAQNGKFSKIQQIIANGLLKAGAGYYIVSEDEKGRLRFYDLKRPEECEKWVSLKV